MSTPVEVPPGVGPGGRVAVADHPWAPVDRPWVAPLTVGALTLAGTAVLGLTDPGTSGIPLCPLKVVTGLDCPFCGSLRAVHALTRVDLGAALDHNVLFTVAVPFLVVGWALWLGRALGVRVPGPDRLPRGSTAALVVLAVVFGVVRNLPAFGWLASGA